LPTHWRPATAEEMASFDRANPQSHELREIALRLKSRSLVATVVDAPPATSAMSRALLFAAASSARLLFGVPARGGSADRECRGAKGADRA
jgi:hypothetical protein